MMTSEPRVFRLPGADAHARAVLLAGALAECGVQRLRMIRGPESRQLLARATDLPGELAKAGECEMVAEDDRLRARSTQDALECVTTDAAMITALERAMKAS